MKTTLTVNEDGVLTFPDEMIETLGWKEGDVLKWTDNHDGSFSLTKPEDDYEKSKYYWDFDRNK